MSSQDQSPIPVCLPKPKEPSRNLTPPPSVLQVDIAYASVPGTEHVLPGQSMWKNNQDAIAILHRPVEPCIAIVCDGCSEGKKSDVGAEIASRVLLKILEEELHQCGNPSWIDWVYVRNRLAQQLVQVAVTMAGNLFENIRDYFLFTTIGFIITREETVVFNFGDGVFIVNGKATILGPFSGNAPPYLMYTITGSPVFDHDPSLAYFHIHTFSTHDIQTIGVGCDGVEDVIDQCDSTFPGTNKKVGSIKQIFEDPFFKNPDLLRRHFALMNRETASGGHVRAGLLPDDTSLVIARVSWK